VRLRVEANQCLLSEGARTRSPCLLHGSAMERRGGARERRRAPAEGCDTSSMCVVSDERLDPAWWSCWVPEVGARMRAGCEDQGW